MKKNRIVLSTYLIYFILVAAFVVIKLLPLKNISDTGKILINSGAQVALFLLPVVLFTLINKQKPKDTFKFFEYKKISGKALFISILIGFVCYFLNLYVASIFDSFIELFGYVSDGGSTVIKALPFTWLLLEMVTKAFLPAVCEETAHRGMLLKGSSPLGYAKAIVISSLLFGLLHMNIEQFFYTALLGGLLGYITVLSDSIYPAMIIHFMNNFLGTYVLFSFSHSLPFGNAFVLITNFMSKASVSSYLFTIAFLALLVMTLILLIRALFRETAGKVFEKLQSAMIKDIMKQDYLAKLSSSKKEILGDNNTVKEVSAEEQYLATNINLGIMTDLDRELLNGQTYKPNFWPVLLLIGSIVLGAAMTISSLILGLI